MNLHHPVLVILSDQLFDDRQQMWRAREILREGRRQHDSRAMSGIPTHRLPEQSVHFGPTGFDDPEVLMDIAQSLKDLCRAGSMRAI